MNNSKSILLVGYLILAIIFFLWNKSIGNEFTVGLGSLIGAYFLFFLGMFVNIISLARPVEEKRKRATLVVLLLSFIGGIVFFLGASLLRNDLALEIGGIFLLVVAAIGLLFLPSVMRKK